MTQSFIPNQPAERRDHAYQGRPFHVDVPRPRIVETPVLTAIRRCQLSGRGVDLPTLESA